MSLIFDKTKYKFYSNIDQLKLKNNNIIKNHPKKVSNKTNHLYNEYITSSPFRNINNNKKSAFLATYQNNSNIMSNNKSEHENNYNNTKKINKEKLKYNKSFEGNLLNGNLNFSKDFGNDDLYNMLHDKNLKNKKFNHSVILNKQNKIKNKKKNNNKSVNNSNIHKNYKKNNNVDQNLIIKKLDEKFKSLESNIIDKEYENDIDHDEMIISSNKRNINFPQTNCGKTSSKNNNNKNYKLSNIIDDINNIKIEYFESSLNNILSNKNDNYDENYLLNTSFENYRNDFNIMYTDNYEESVMNDMLSLEIKLLIEKMLEMQKSYHKEFNLIISQYNKNDTLFKLLIEKIKILKKKMNLIKKIKEIKNIKTNLYNFIGIYNHKNQYEINKINKSEIILWKNFTGQQDKYNEVNIRKLKDLFKQIIFDKYYKLFDKLNNIENKIIINLMKKHKYIINKKSNEIKYNGNIVSITNSDKKKILTASPIQQHKNIIKQTKNVNSKKSHKKTSSCCPVKSTNHIFFKTSKKK